MTDEMKKIIDDVVFETSTKYAQRIEKECKAVCEKYKCDPRDLILQVKLDGNFSININASNFKIEHEFVFGKSNE